MYRNSILFLVLASLLFCFPALDSEAAGHQDIEHHYYYDSQGNYTSSTTNVSGAENPTSRTTKTYYHITDSNGDTHSLHVSTVDEIYGTFTIRYVIGDTVITITYTGWLTTSSWYIEYDEIEYFFDSNTD